jgi:hypothetical protein
MPSDPGLLEQGMAFCRHIYDNLPTHTFQARDIQLVAFQSEDWAGEWWETLTYKQIAGWRLAD